MSSLVEEHDQLAFHPRKHNTFTTGDWQPTWEALEQSITINPLKHIADAIRRLTYGEMVTLAAEINSCGEVGTQPLESILHKWSLAHGATRSATGLAPQKLAGNK